MKKNLAIKIENISKKYQIGEKEVYGSLRDSLSNITKFLKKNKKVKDFWALKDVSFDVMKGEVLGLIGPNGAGKSTLLKILAKITKPTNGKIQMRGRVSSLLEIGTGFHPELTGRENIYISGNILGMTNGEVAEKFDEIVKFSGLKKFLDTPVKRYSSGMSVRLAFSVAAHLEPEILLVDEVLAVGDAQFQKRSLGKMEEVTKSDGRTIIFVSHDMGAIQSLCSRVILLNKGRVKFLGSPTRAIDNYSKLYMSGRRSNRLSGSFFTELPELIINKIVVNNDKNIIFGDNLKFIIFLKTKREIKGLQMGLFITNSRHIRVMTGKVDVEEINSKKKKIEITIEKPNLPPGNYYLTLGLGIMGKQIFRKENILSFNISLLGVKDTFLSSRGDTLGVYPKTNYKLL